MRLRDVDLSFLEHPPEAMQFGDTIDASADEVFDIVADSAQLAAWLQDFVSVETFTEPPHGVGMKRRVKLKTLSVDERFVVWERGKRLSFVMEAISLPIVRAMGEDLRFEALSEKQCRVRWRVGYEPSNLMVPVHPLAKKIFGSLFQRSLTALKAYAEGRH